MPYYIAGEVPRLEDLMVVTPEEFETKRGIKVNINHRVEAIDPAAKKVKVTNLTSGQSREESYDRLVIATGAEPIIPHRVDPGTDGVFVLQDLNDAEAIKRTVDKRRIDEGLIVGGGYIGLEMAECLTRAGVKVTLIVRGPRLMSRLEPELSADILDQLTGQGVRVIPEVKVSGIRPIAGERLEVTLTDDTRHTFGLVLVAVGVAPRSELAAGAGLELGVRGAIKVDRHGRTSAPGIWAGGDCAEAWHRLTEDNAWIPLALTANKMGRVIGDNLAGIDALFPGMLGTSVTKVFDLTVARTGLDAAECAARGIEVSPVKVVAPSKPHYYPGGGPIKTIMHIDRADGRVWGVQMVGVDGVAQRIDTWVAALSAGMTLDQVADLDLAYAPPFATTWGAVAVSAEVAAKKIGSGK